MIGMQNEQTPKDKVLISQALDITNLKITIETLNDELESSKEQINLLQEEFGRVLKEGKYED